MLTLRLAPEDQPDTERPLRLELVLPELYRPFDLGINEDRRWLGVAVSSVVIEPEPSSEGASHGRPH